MDGVKSYFKKHHLSPYLLVILSFFFIIVLGAFLLDLPISNKSGNWGEFINTFYMATSATCVTGYDIYADGMINTYTLFGQIIMAIMIQIGGLGFLTVLVFFITTFRRNVSFKDRAFMSQAVNSDSIAEVAKFVRKLLLSTLIIELIGFLLGLPVFFAVYENKGEAIWGSIFLSISAFNNAGFDLFGNGSLIRGLGTVCDRMPDWAYHYMLGYTMVLIVLGGISFLVIMDIFPFKKKPSQWRAFTKISLAMTVILILAGWGLLMLTDCIKPDHNITPLDALYQSISSRTAGFSTYDPYYLSVGGRIITCVLMFIGGAPLGTASGIKTTTVFILITTIYCYLRGKKSHAFNRYFSKTMFIKATFVTLLSIFIVLIGYFSLVMFEQNSNPFFSGEHAVFETISSFSTTGYTTALTINLSIGGKITCSVLMFLGRLGPMTFFQIISNNMDKSVKTKYNYVEEEILIG